MSDRIDAFLRRLEHLSVDDLSVIALAPADPDERDRLLRRIDAAATAAGRMDDVDEAADAARDVLVRAFAVRGLDPTWFGLNWGRSLSRPEDRALLIQAAEDAAMAAVVEDLVPEDAAALGEPFELVAAMAGAAPTANPSAGRIGPNLVRVAWVVGAIGWILLTVQLLLDLVEKVIEDLPSPLLG
jgi:hypothetical protein